MAEEEQQLPEQKEKKTLNPILLIIIGAVLMLIIAAGVSFFMVKLLGSNIQSQENKANTATLRTPVISKAELIKDGSREPVMLKGGREVAVISALEFKVGSEECGSTIGANKVEIKDAIRMLFLNKTRAEVTTQQGMELLRKQIKDAVNEITGYTGERENLGVRSVNIIIMTIQQQ